ncbi:MAG: CHASE2 domain-containing protein, partial [Syntrophobacteraceae bacterium]|nr:CHASE2 domain-containing protein [Syntrophobacteraceae bacterium]
MRDKRTIRLILTACGVLAFVLFIDDLGLLRGMNRQAYDFFHCLRGPREPSQNIIIAAIDERTLQHLGRWPIDRKHYATLLDRLKSAEAVGIDIILGEATESDGMLAEAMEGRGRVILPVYFDPGGHLMSPPASLAPTAVGHIHIEQDVDGIAREVYHTIHYRGEAIPSFASAIYDKLPGKKLPRDGSLPGKEDARQPAFLHQTDSMLINYYGPRETFRHVSFLEILQGRWSEGFFKGKVVLAGLTTAGVEGELLTPFTDEGTRMPGVEVHAHILNNLLDGSYYRRVETRWIWLALGVLACLYFPVCAGMSPVQLAVIWSCSLLGGSALSFSALAFFNVWVVPGPFFTLITAASVAVYITTLHDMRTSLLQSKNDWEESFNTIDDAITIYGKDCRVARVNRAASEKIGDSLFRSLDRMCSGFIRAEGSRESSRHGALENEDLTARA